MIYFLPFFAFPGLFWQMRPSWSWNWEAREYDQPLLNLIHEDKCHLHNLTISLAPSLNCQGITECLTNVKHICLLHIRANWLLNFGGYYLPVPIEAAGNGRQADRAQDPSKFQGPSAGNTVKIKNLLACHKNKLPCLNRLNYTYFRCFKVGKHISVIVPCSPLGHHEKLLICVNFYFHHFNIHLGACVT